VNGDELVALAVLPVIECPHVMATLLRISASAYADAARQLKDGNLKANPLTIALIEHGSYVLFDYTAERILVRDFATGQKYSALMPPMLAQYLECFQSGVRVLEDYEFELILDTDVE
jgi:hypothetical protein